MAKEDVKKFDTWITANYNDLQKYCKKYRIEEDILNTVYINVRDIIQRSGFTNTYYQTYVKRAIRNLQINEAKKNNNKHFIDSDNEDYTNTIEERLQDNDETEKDTQEYREELMYLSKMIFKFLDEKFTDEEDKFIFRCYYLMEGRMTYAKLQGMTGFEKSKCTRIIQNFKQEIRQNFLNWLKENGRQRDN